MHGSLGKIISCCNEKAM